MIYISNVQEEYKKRIINPADLAKFLKPGTKVFLEQGPTEPHAIVNALMSQVDVIQGIQIVIIPIPNINGSSPN